LENIENDILTAWEALVSKIYKLGDHVNLIEHMTAFYEKYGEYISVLLSPSGDPLFIKKIKDTLRLKMFKFLDVSSGNTELLLIFEFISSAMLAFLTEWFRHSKHFSARQAVDLLQALSSENIMSVMLKYAGNSK